MALKLSCLACVVFAASGFAQKPVPLVIEAHGGVTVRGANQSQITSRSPLQIRKTPNALIVTVTRPRAEIVVPRAVPFLAVRTVEGPVSVSSLTGEVDIESIAGSITLNDLQGSVSARTGGGEIRLGRLTGPVATFTGGGGITAERLEGESTLETTGGEVNIADALNDLRVISGGGNVTVRSARVLVAETRGGCVEVGRATGRVSARTMGGAIRLGPVSGAVDAATVVGSILAELADANDRSALDARSGDITVVLPSNIAVTVQAQNEGPGRGSRVFSDFPEIELFRGRWFPARAMVARGAINGGGPLLQLSAGGVIRLERKE